MTATPAPSPAARSVARIRPEAPAHAWAFETTPLAAWLENLGLDDLSRASTARRIVGTVDLCRTGGAPVRRLARLPIPSPVAVGAARRMELAVEMKALAGDYELRFGLERDTGPFAGPLPVDAAPAPLHVEHTIFDAFVELVNACNFRCTFCPQTTLQRPQRPMEFELATKVVRDLADMGHHYPIRVHLLGEPLLYKRFFDFVEAAHDMGQRIALATNGSRFLEPVVRDIFRTRLDEMVISLNTPEKELYDAQRGTSMPYADYVAGIERMVGELVRRGPPPYTRINILYDIQKHDDPEQLAKVHAVANHWIDVVRRVSGRPLEPAQGVIDLTPGRPTLYRLTAGLELQWTSYHNWGEKGGAEGFCSFPWRQLAVLVDGSATACCVDAEGEIVLGNACEQSVAEIWNGPRLNALRQGFLAGRAVHPRCARCDVRHDLEEFFPRFKLGAR